MPSSVSSYPNNPKSLSRRLSREGSFSSLSLDDHYYCQVPLAVPFKWESQPGTPKINRRETTHPPPPLTPPPSYYHRFATERAILKHTDGILVERGSSCRNFSLPTSPASSSSSSSPWLTSSSPVFRSPASPRQFRLRSSSRVSSKRLSFDSRRQAWEEVEEVEEVEEEEGSEVSLVCLGAGGSNSRGCYASIIQLVFGDVRL